MRNKDVVVYPISYMAFHFLWRFGMKKEGL